MTTSKFLKHSIITKYIPKLFSSKNFVNRIKSTVKYSSKEVLATHKNSQLKTNLLDTHSRRYKSTKTLIEDHNVKLSRFERRALIQALAAPKKLDELYQDAPKILLSSDPIASERWKMKFGQDSKVPDLYVVDPTGNFCILPDRYWEIQPENIKEASQEAAKHSEFNFHPIMTSIEMNALLHLALFSSVPFIGFGFLDNFIMIVAGDYIEHMFGTMMCMSTMMAAAFGNTLSDLAGLGSAYYIESCAGFLGFTPPKLSQTQLSSKSCHRAINVGRFLGIMLGCLVGMFPLLFISEQSKEVVEPCSSDMSADPLPENETEEYIVKKEKSKQTFYKMKYYESGTDNKSLL